MSGYDFRDLPEWDALQSSLKNFLDAHKRETAFGAGAEMLLTEFVVCVSMVPVDSRERFHAHNNVFASSTIPHHATGLMAHCQAFLEESIFDGDVSGGDDE